MVIEAGQVWQSEHGQQILIVEKTDCFVLVDVRNFQYIAEYEKGKLINLLLKRNFTLAQQSLAYDVNLTGDILQRQCHTCGLLYYISPLAQIPVCCGRHAQGLLPSMTKFSAMIGE